MKVYLLLVEFENEEGYGIIDVFAREKDALYQCELLENYKYRPSNATYQVATYRVSPPKRLSEYQPS
jgi:hypothetical protein